MIMKKVSIKCWFLILVFVLFVPATKAQTKRKGLASITVEAPDTVEQGVHFDLRFIIIAPHWEKWQISRQMAGVTLSNLDYIANEINGSKVLTIRALAYTSKTGDINLPRICIPIDGKEVTSESKRIFVRSNRNYGEEMDAAMQCLIGHGMDADSVSLKMERSEDGIVLFVDQQFQGFAIVAEKRYWPQVGNPILAFSTEGGFISPNNNPRNYWSLIKPLANQLKSLKCSATTITQDYQPKHDVVNPMLGMLRWGQAQPYNQNAPVILRNNKKAVIGCVPLAAAMIMNYYQWPEKGRSHIYYKPDNTTYSMDYTKCQPHWTEYKNEYKIDDIEAADNLSHLLVSLGIACDATFSNEATSATLGKVKHALCNNFLYSGKMRFQKEDMSDATILDILYQELDEGRPCLVSNGSHAFVCDGYEGDFLHFNFGWNGQCNGYYRLKLGTYDKVLGPDNFVIRSLIHHIQPEKQPLNCSVTLKKAGTLVDLLTQEQKENCTSLVVQGPLNSYDIRLLRHMAGAPADTLFKWPGGALRYLDLSGARIIADKKPYLSQQATGSWSRTESWRDVSTITGKVHVGRTHVKKATYDLEKMSADEWRKFKRDIGSKQDGFFYTFDEERLCRINYHCTKSEIGNLMFSECSSLQNINIPSNTKAVGDYAFVGCSSLMEIYLPPKVTKLGKKPFYYCLSLEKVEVPNQCQLSHEGVAEECSPHLKSITLYKP